MKCQNVYKSLLHNHDNRISQEKLENMQKRPHRTLHNMLGATWNGTVQKVDFWHFGPSPKSWFWTMKFQNLYKSLLRNHMKRISQEKLEKIENCLFTALCKMASWQCRVDFWDISPSLGDRKIWEWNLKELSSRQRSCRESVDVPEGQRSCREGRTSLQGESVNTTKKCFTPHSWCCWPRP